MLKKLLKYDFKYMIKNMSIFYILALVFAIITRILFSLKQTVMINVFASISVGCMFSMVGSILFNTIIRSWVRFKDSIYKDESYLTHTLPVTKTEIYESRFLQTIIFTLVGFVFMLLSVFITYYTKERWLMLKDVINNISTGLNLNTTLFVIVTILLLFLEIINAIQSGYLGMIIGFNKDNNKVCFSFLFGFIAYVASQIVTVLTILIAGLFDSSIMDLFKNAMVLDNNSIKLVFIVAIFAYVFAILLMNIICKEKLKKGVNVE